MIGGSGGRVDHFIALLSLFKREKKYNSIMDFPDFWLTEENLIVFCKKKSKFQISGLEQSDNVSVFSLFENNFFKPKIFSSGLKWKLQNVNWKSQWSLSNRICENSSFGPTWHTVNDNINNIDRNTLKAVGQTVMDVIYNEK